MRTKKTKIKGNEGSVILITLLLTFVISMMVAGAVTLVLHEFKFSMISSNRAQSLHAAEAGIDFAIASLQQFVQYGYDWEDNGWSKDGDIYSMADIDLTMDGHITQDASFSISLDTNLMVATAGGFMAEPGTGGTITRTIQVDLEPDWMYRFEKGLLGKDVLTFQGVANCDSYNSNDGPYDPVLNVSTNCDIGSMALSIEGIEGGGTVLVQGDVYVTEAGDAVGEFWTGEEFGSLDVDIPPYIPERTDITDVAVFSETTIDVLGDQYMGVPSFDGKNKEVIIQGEGKLTIYVAGDFEIGTASTLTLIPATNKTLEVIIIVNGEHMDMLGTLNNDGPPLALQLYGTQNCLDVKVTANDEKSLVVYAPSASITLAGSASVFGSIVGAELYIGGGFDFHFDEALATNDTPILAGFTIENWREL